jgi:hypothetical protein
MSTDHIDDQPDAEVVPLRATDAGTEAKVAEAPGPAYTDLSDGRPARKPIIPAHWRTREAAREHVKLTAARHGHAAAYHGVRVPGYVLLTSWWALVGIGPHDQADRCEAVPEVAPARLHHRRGAEPVR